MNTKIIFLSLIAASMNALAGGSLIGNGAGLVENNFQYVYSSLPTVYSNCLSNNSCGLSESEMVLVQKILNVIELNKDNSKRLQFVQESDVHGFFTTGVGEKHRIAKTGLTAEDPIYINVNQLYDSNGRAALDFGTIVSILTHELGHQAGETDHARLDILGTKFKKVFTQKITNHVTNFGTVDSAVEILVLNNEFPVKTADLFLSWSDVGAQRLTTAVIPAINCSGIGSTVAGFEFYNGHYFISEKSTSARPVIGFGLWLNVFCYNSKDDSLITEKIDVKLEIGSDSVVNMFSARIL